jgi:HSP20 family protein
MEAAMANITRYNPFEEMFKDFGKGFLVRPYALPAETELSMKLDVTEGGNEYIVQAEVPGVKKEDIHVDVEGDTVSLRAEVKQEKEEKKGEKVVYSERTYGMVSRSFALPAQIDGGAVKAEYKDGLLKLTLPKKANGAGRRITVS